MTVGELVQQLQAVDQSLELLTDDGVYGLVLMEGECVQTIHAAEDGDGIFRGKVYGYGKDYAVVC